MLALELPFVFLLSLLFAILALLLKIAPFEVGQGELDGATGFLIGSAGRPSDLSPVLGGATDPAVSYDDPPALMASALAIFGFVAWFRGLFLIARLPRFGATDLDISAGRVGG